MAAKNKTAPVKLFAGILFSETAPLLETKTALEKIWGPIDFESEIFPFEEGSHYYEKEMGKNIQRVFYSFLNLIQPEALPRFKTEAAQIENQFSHDACRMTHDKPRRINVDPGYIDCHKVVLASYKEARQKIHLGDGVWADTVLFYSKGKYEPLPWSFADFAGGQYEKIFLKMRELYKAKL